MHGLLCLERSKGEGYEERHQQRIDVCLLCVFIHNSI